MLMGREFHRTDKQWKKGVFQRIASRERNFEGGIISTWVELEECFSISDRNKIMKTKTKTN